MRRFVVVGQRATASPVFSLLDLPSTSGRLDVLLRCLRAALLVSHGLRRDTVAYLVLLGGSDARAGGAVHAARCIRIEGARIRFLRPDERSLATLVQKVLAMPSAGASFTEMRAGIAIADGGFETVLADIDMTRATPYVLEEGGSDLRTQAVDPDSVIFVGDHLGFDAATRARIAELGAAPIGVGPVSVHADDAITIVCNELDRRSGADRSLS